MLPNFFLNFIRKLLQFDKIFVSNVSDIACIESKGFKVEKILKGSLDLIPSPKPSRRAEKNRTNQVS